METEKTLLIVSEESSAAPDEANKCESSANEKPVPVAEGISPAALEDGNFVRPWRPLELMSVDDHFKLDENNYCFWYHTICRNLRAAGAFNHLTDPGPEPEDPGYKFWHADDHMIVLWLWNSMSPEIGDICLFMNSAKDIWDNMHHTYFKSRRFVKMHDIKMKIRSAEQGNKKLPEYLGQLKGLWNELEFYRGTLKGWPEDEASIKRLIEEDRTLDFLIGLNPEYSILKYEFLFSQELPPLMKVYHRIFNEEGWKSLFSSRDDNNLATSMGNLHVSENRKPRRSENKIWCTYCNKPYHTREQCWKLHGRP